MYEFENYHWWFVARRHLIVYLIKSLKIQFPTILDVGTGTGGNLMMFSKLGKSFGIDACDQAIELCNKRELENVIQCPIERIEYEDRTFDIITCLDVLEHLPDTVGALLELKRILRDDGKIIITVPAFKILWSQHDEALCHFRRYERSSLSDDLREVGLKIEKMSYFFFASFFVVAPIRIMRRFLISKQGKIHSDTTTLPPKLLNEFLKLLFRIEAKISVNFGLPFGTTLYAIVSK
jgi:SAM-dependent methyltransferase